MFQSALQDSPQFKRFPWIQNSNGIFQRYTVLQMTIMPYWMTSEELWTKVIKKTKSLTKEVGELDNFVEVRNIFLSWWYLFRSNASLLLAAGNFFLFWIPALSTILFSLTAHSCQSHLSKTWIKCYCSKAFYRICHILLQGDSESSQDEAESYTWSQKEKRKLISL